ncbi:hypothetical protein [Candidatus Protofrankia californiensis]|uniref:hypothetical protein n=1 Tax=Candidatus Protofrankia californiensis TaxID=1839754 RepID=UPI0019D2F385|nr:hypothetical protein [Candidatus Protofrankia californiensis]
MRGDVHGGFREGPGARFPRPTHPVVHCGTRRQAEQVRAAIGRRLEEVGLRLHPAKTRVVYCKDSSRRNAT